MKFWAALEFLLAHFVSLFVGFLLCSVVLWLHPFMDYGN